MTWVKLDDNLMDHPKIVDLSADAFRLHIAGLCWCSRFLTDGAIPASQAPRLVPKYRKALVSELVAAGLWDVTDTGWQVHNYLDFQPSAEKVRADRAAAAARMAAARERRGRSSGERAGELRSTPARPGPARRATGRGSGSEVVGAEPEPLEPDRPATEAEIAARNAALEPVRPLLRSVGFADPDVTEVSA